MLKVFGIALDGWFEGGYAVVAANNAEEAEQMIRDGRFSPENTVELRGIQTTLTEPEVVERYTWAI